MDDEEFSREIAAELDRRGYIDSAGTLAVAMLDVLGERLPGFEEAVRAQLEQRARKFEEGREHGDAERARSVRELITGMFPD